MQVSGIGNNALGSPAIPAANDPLKGLGRDEFLKLLTIQMRHQNPLAPIQDADFIAQLAQFSTLDGVTKLNSSFADMLLLQGLTQGANLIGKTVVYAPAGSPTDLQRGRVEAVTAASGKIELIVNGSAVALNHVRGIVPG
jgi:flagellar basal-body rod modification protein FlgD